MLRRRASALVALGLLGCSAAPGASSIGSEAPAGFVVVTAGGTALVDGEDDVPPTLDLGLAGAGVSPAVVAASLDGARLQLAGGGGGAHASVPAMAYGTSHHLELAIGGRARIEIDFRVVGRSGVSAAGWLNGPGQVAADVAFERAPTRSGVAAALAGAQLSWLDDSHLRLRWSAPSAVLDIPAGVATARGSVLDGPLHLSLIDVRGGELRRATVPMAPAAPSHLALTVWTTSSAASQESTRTHARAATVVSPTGWRAAADGSLAGAPDPAAFAATGDNRSVWPLLATDSLGSAQISGLLNDAGAQVLLVAAVVSGVRRLGAGGVHLDFEGMSGDDRDHFTAFAAQLAVALHAVGAQLAVDVVPHRPGAVNAASAAYDDPALAAVADRLVVMTYDQHTQIGDPGPVAGIDWQSQELAGSLAGVPSTKVLLGLPFYSRRWSGDSVSAAGYAGAVSQALREPAVAYDYDFPAATPVLRSRPDGVPTQLWFDDADSLLRKVASVSRFKLAGVAAWRTGFEDPAVWSVL